MKKYNLAPILTYMLMIYSVCVSNFFSFKHVYVAKNV